jgi:hypothetical protein
VVIDYALPDGTRVRLAVEVADTAPDVYAVLGYDVSLRLWQRTGAYPVAEVERYVSGVVGRPVRWRGCTHRDAEDGGAVEVWRFA